LAANFLEAFSALAQVWLETLLSEIWMNSGWLTAGEPDALTANFHRPMVCVCSDHKLSMTRIK
jgi:hypothetical protein